MTDGPISIIRSSCWSYYICRVDMIFTRFFVFSRKNLKEIHLTEVYDN
nr:MAG TPA: hypothetical protein [Caudoviricetes sp.]